MKTIKILKNGGIALAFLTLSLSANAVPNTFTAGNKALASEVNENFTDLQSQIDSLAAEHVEVEDVTPRFTYQWDGNDLGYIYNPVCTGTAPSELIRGGVKIAAPIYDPVTDKFYRIEHQTMVIIYNSSCDVNAGNRIAPPNFVYGITQENGFTDTTSFKIGDYDARIKFNMCKKLLTTDLDTDSLMEMDFGCRPSIEIIVGGTLIDFYIVPAYSVEDKIVGTSHNNISHDWTIELDMEAMKSNVIDLSYLQSYINAIRITEITE